MMNDYSMFRKLFDAAEHVFMCVCYFLFIIFPEWLVYICIATLIVCIAILLGCGIHHLIS